MTSREVCEYLGISAPTLNRRVLAGELKPINQKTKGQKRVPAYRFLRADIERYNAQSA